MSTLYVHSDTFGIDYSKHLLDFIDSYEVDLVVCGNREIGRWCDRWFLKKKENVPMSKAIEMCDACVTFTSHEDTIRIVSEELDKTMKPYVIFKCNYKGEVEYVM